MSLETIPAATARALAGRPAAALLELSSVQRMVTLLGNCCRETSWARIAVATLERYRRAVDIDLGEVLDRALADTGVAERSLVQFGDVVARHGPAHVSALALGAKLWFRANGVAASWRPLSTAAVDPGTQFPQRDRGTRLLLSAMIGSGLTAREVMDVRVGDLGSLDARGRIVPDPMADPLAVAYRPEGGGGPRVSFLSHAARAVWLTDRDRSGDTDAASPFVSRNAGDPAGTGILEAAAGRHAALIAAGNDANVFTCRLTGDFFRTWGMPGERFEHRLRARRAGGDGSAEPAGQPRS